MSAGKSVQKIAIFGNGLAGLLCAAKLVQILPAAVELIYVEETKASDTDDLFGTVTSQTIYEFFLGLGIYEPDIVQQTNSSFSLGTQYKNWGPENRSWTQSFYRSLPAYNGVGFHHYLTRVNAASKNTADIQPYIMSVQAAQAGVFAHPPEGKNIPLADVEYGYHFDADMWRRTIRNVVKSSNVTWIKSDVLNATWRRETLRSVSLSDGRNIEADFFIDALGPNSELATGRASPEATGRQLKATKSFVPSETLGGTCRILTGTPNGWTSETPLQNGTTVLTVFDSNFDGKSVENPTTQRPLAFDVTLGRQLTPWSGNCLTLGHGAARIEPLTPAPMILLQRDIDRLAELLPVTEKMRVESREYNRRFNADYDHAELFQSAFYMSDISQETADSNAVTNSPPDQKLLNKITQFKSRGVLVQYDYEPFTERDWTVLYFGLGFYPDRYDPLADHIPDSQLKHRLAQMRTAIEIMVKKMPPHHIYMTGLLKYLKEKNG